MDMGRLTMRSPVRFRATGRGASAARLLLSSCLCGLSIAGTAFAQESGTSAASEPTSSQADAGEGGEIVVTAQKRTERLQDVPVSVAVLQPESLTAFGTNDAVQLAYRIPNVSLQNSAGPRSFGFFIRGIGTTSFAVESIESSSAFVVDGVVLGQAGSSLMDLPDLERVEVLRGPQGTLFGKNASAGVINVVTRRPSGEPTAEFRASLAYPDADRRFSAYVSGPLSDEVRYSLSARLNRRDGYVDNLFDGRELNDEKSYGFRGKLELEPSDDLTMTLIGDFWQRRADCCIFTVVSASTPPAALETALIAAGAEIGEHNLEANIDGGIFADVDSYGFSAQADYGFGDHTLTSISAYRKWRTLDGLDTDAQPVNLFNANFAELKQNQFSQELRLTSPKGAFVDYVAGLFYFNTNVDTDSTQLQPASSARLVNRLVNVTATTENLAAFGQANLNFTPDFRAIVGARVLKENYEAGKRRFDPVTGASDSAAAEKDDTAFLWRLGLQYDFSRDVNVFATVTRGYKGGGFDTGIGFRALPDVQPERPIAYEAGLRAAVPDAGLTFNVTGFWQKVKDFQVNARDPVDPTLFTILNAATAETKGFEAELYYRPFDDVDFNLSAALAYADAEFDTFRGAPCYRGQTAALGCVGGVQDLSGMQLPFAQKWTGNANAAYATPLGSGGLELSTNLNVSYRSKSFQNSPNDPRTIQGGFALVDVAVGIGAEDGRWKLSAFGRNVTDRHYNTRKFSTPFTTGPLSYGAYIPYEAQAIYGVSADLKF